MLQLLETFCSVAETGSFTKTAEALHITQPAVTRQIKTLESRLGAVLLIRTPFGVELTPVGQALLPHAKEAVAAAAACVRVARAGAGNGPAALNIAAGLTVTIYYLPPVLAEFRQHHGDVTVNLFPGHHAEVVERLLSYQADVALLATEVKQPGLRQTVLFADPYVLIGPPGSQAPSGDARVADLANADLLVLPPQSGQRAEVDSALIHRQVDCRRIEYPTLETLKSAVGAGLGVAIVPASAVRAEAAAGTLAVRTLSDWPERERAIRMLVRAEGAVPEHVRTLISLLRKRYGHESPQAN